MLNKTFAQRLNEVLDEVGVPVEMPNRIDALSKMFHIPKFKAETLLNGHISDETLVIKLAQEFEVDAGWLQGKPHAKFNPHP